MEDGSSEDGIPRHRVKPLEAIEHYTARHSEKFEEVIHWPWKRFELAYSSMVKREIVEELTQRKFAVISGIYANNSFEKDEKADRSEVIEEIEYNFKKTVAMVYGDLKEEEESELEGEYMAYSEENPFFAAGKRAMDKLDIPKSEAEDNFKTEELVEIQKEMDQFDS